MIDLKNRMIRYLVAENCADSTIKTYTNTLKMLLYKHPDFEFYNNEKMVHLLSEIKDPIYRSSIRNVVLKVHRDMLGRNVNIPFIKKPERLQKVYLYIKMSASVKNIIFKFISPLLNGVLRHLLNFGD